MFGVLFFQRIKILFLCIFFVSASAYCACAAHDVTPITWADLQIRDASPKSFAQDNNEQDSVATKNRVLPTLNKSLNNKLISIKGFVVPLEYNQEAELQSMLLVPYFGACIHVPPPPQNQIILVEFSEPQKNIHSMDIVYLEGRLVLQDVVANDVKAAYKLVNARNITDNSGLPNNFILISLLICLCALSVCLGWILPISKINVSVSLMSIVAAISSGMMLSLSFSSTFLNISGSKIFLFAVGLLLMYFFNHFFHAEAKSSNYHNIACSTAVACAFHNFPECFFILSIALGNFSVGLTLTLAMMGHNIPLGLSLGFIAKNITLKERLKYTIIAGILPSLAVIFIYLSLREYVTVDIMRQIYPFAGGCLASIALFHLIPLSIKNGSLKQLIFWLGIGFSLIGLLLYSVNFFN